jgi:hypothetical protein
MYNNTGVKIRKITAVLLVIMSVCVMFSAQAEAVSAETLFGEVKNDTYGNSFLGLGCTLEGWHYYTDEEMETVNQATKEALSENMDEMLSQNISVMMAEGPDHLQNVNIRLQNVKAYVSIYKSMGLQNVATAALDQFKSTVESAGFTDVQLEVSEISIGDQVFTCIKGEYYLKGVHMYFKQLWDLRDDYMVTVTVTTVQEDTTDEVLSKFFLL